MGVLLAEGLDPQGLAQGGGPGGHGGHDMGQWRVQQERAERPRPSDLCGLWVSDNGWYVISEKVNFFYLTLPLVLLEMLDICS